MVQNILYVQKVVPILYNELLYKMEHYLDILGASEVSANLYCNSRTFVLGRLRDYFRLLAHVIVVVAYPNTIYIHETADGELAKLIDIITSCL